MQATFSRDQLIADYADIARRIALKMARRCPEWVTREDIVSAGMLGLTEAAARYDDSRTEPFLAFAELRIRGAVLDELRRGDLLPRRVRQKARKVAAAVRELEASGETASDARIALKLGVSLEHYRTRLAHLLQVQVDVLDERSPELVTSEASSPEEQAAHSQELARVKAALAKLEQRDITILGLHYIEELTFQEIGKTLSVTPSRVCQLLWRAVERVRAHLRVEVVAVRAVAAAA